MAFTINNNNKNNNDKKKLRQGKTVIQNNPKENHASLNFTGQNIKSKVFSVARNPKNKMGKNKIKNSTSATQ